MEGYVYKITNILNDEKYIGSTVDFDKRKRTHLNGLRGNYHDNRVLQEAFDRYGEDVFEFEVICITGSETERYRIEEEVIQELKTYEVGYNMTTDGRGRYVLTDKTREKMSENSKGENNPFYGKKHTLESRAKMSKRAKVNNKGKNNPFYGKTHTQDTLDKMAKSFEKLKESGWTSPQKGVPKSKQAVHNNMLAQPNRKPVHVNGKEYPSISACAKELGISNGTVRNRINNKDFPDYYYIK